MDQEERQEVYIIPQNYGDAGGILGYRITWRFVIDLLTLGVPLILINWILPVSILIHLVIALITLFPVFAFAFIGIDGESPSQLIISIIRFRLQRCKFSYISFSAPVSEGSPFQIKRLQARIKKAEKVALTAPAKPKEPTQKVKVAPAKKKPISKRADQKAEPKPVRQVKQVTKLEPPERESMPEPKKAARTPKIKLERNRPPKVRQASPNAGLLRGAIMESLIEKFELSKDDDDQNQNT